MDISQDLIDEAKRILHEGVSDLPKSLLGTDFFVAMANDSSVIAHGVVRHEGIEYKIGPKRDR